LAADAAEYTEFHCATLAVCQSMRLQWPGLCVFVSRFLPTKKPRVLL
jgi:hypothetical protein